MINETKAELINVSAVSCLYSLVSRHTLYMLIFINHNEITSDFLFKIKKLIVSQIYKSMCIHESYVNMCVYGLYFSTHFHVSQPNSANIFEFSISLFFRFTIAIEIWSKDSR